MSKCCNMYRCGAGGCRREATWIESSRIFVKNLPLKPWPRAHTKIHSKQSAPRRCIRGAAGRFRGHLQGSTKVYDLNHCAVTFAFQQHSIVWDSLLNFFCLDVARTCLIGGSLSAEKQLNHISGWHSLACLRRRFWPSLVSYSFWSKQNPVEIYKVGIPKLQFINPPNPISPYRI